MGDDDHRLARIAQILDRLNQPDLERGERRRLEQELARLGDVLRTPTMTSPMPLVDFPLKPPIDMAAIYERRRQLDDRFGL